MRCNRIIKSSLQWTSLPYFLLLCSLQKKRKKRETKYKNYFFFFSLAQKEKSHSSLLTAIRTHSSHLLFSISTEHIAQWKDEREGRCPTKKKRIFPQVRRPLVGHTLVLVIELDNLANITNAAILSQCIL